LKAEYTKLEEENAKLIEVVERLKNTTEEELELNANIESMAINDE